MENLGVSRESVAVFNRVRRLVKDEFGVDLRLAQPDIVAQAKHYLALTASDNCREQLERWLKHVESTNSRDLGRGKEAVSSVRQTERLDDKADKRSFRKRIIYRGRELFK